MQKKKSNLFVGKCSFSGSRQSLPLFFLPLIPEDAVIQNLRFTLLATRYIHSRIKRVCTKPEKIVFTYTPEKKRCDHPANGEVVVAEDVDAEPGKAATDETKIKKVDISVKNRELRIMKTTNNITSRKQFLVFFPI